MTDATGIVKRSVTTILDKAAMGEIQTRGSDMIDYSPDLDINLSNVNIICRNGYKGVEDGCGKLQHNLRLLFQLLENLHI